LSLIEVATTDSLQTLKDEDKTVNADSSWLFAGTRPSRETSNFLSFADAVNCETIYTSNAEMMVFI
jgi:hypothetical protein